MTLYAAVSHVADSDRVRAKWYQLEESERRIGDFKVGVVPIVPLVGAASDGVVLGEKPKRTISRYPRKKRAPARKADDLSALRDAVENSHDVEPSDHSGSGGCEDDLGDADLGDVSDVDTPYIEGIGDDCLEALVAMSDEQLCQPCAPPPESAPLANGMSPLGTSAPPASAGVPPPSSSAAEAAFPVPAPPSPVAPARTGRRKKPAATATFPWGKISYYESNKGIFEATCWNPNHGKCVMTRSARALASSSRAPMPRGGRPCGFLAAWLELSCTADKAQHWSPEVMHTSREARRSAREALKATDAGRLLLSYERPRAVDETSEPDTLEGLI